jgi:hypothetical protein
MEIVTLVLFQQARSGAGINSIAGDKFSTLPPQFNFLKIS